MSHILVTYSSKTPTVELVKKNMTALAEIRTMKIREVNGGEVTRKDIQWADTVIIIRPFDTCCSDIAKSAKNGGKFVVVYLDDDLLNLPNLYISGIRKWISVILKRKNEKSLLDCIKICDVLWGSNDYLLRKYKKYLLNGRCAKSEITADISYMHKVNKREDKEVKILFAGASDHAKLLNKYIIPAMNQISSKYYKLHFTCIGVDRNQILSCKVPVTFVPWINNYDEYREFVDGEGYHIGLAVIENEEFYKCKYYNKFIEYSLLGAVGIYTKSEPYSLVVRNEENGFLVDTTVTLWADALSYAIEHPEICEACAESAQRFIRQRFSKEQVLMGIEKAIPELSIQHGNYAAGVIYHPRRVWNMIRRLGIKLVDNIEEYMFRVKK